MEVKQDLQERMTRWRQIESLCGFSITTNPGFNYLETLLRSNLNSSRYVVLNPGELRRIGSFFYRRNQSHGGSAGLSPVSLAYNCLNHLHRPYLVISPKRPALFV